MSVRIPLSIKFTQKTRRMLGFLFCLLHLRLLQSITIVDVATRSIGVISYEITSSDQIYKCTIEPEVGVEKVLFTFKFLNSRSSELQIYDSVSGESLFSCINCDNFLPPPFFSVSGSLHIQFTGVLGSSFITSSFELQYVAQVPFSSKVSNADTDFTIYLYMSYGSISPVLMSGNTLLANTKMRWILDVGDTDELKFSIAKFDLGDKCVAKLQIFDGLDENANLLYSGCKSSDATPYWIYASNGRALISLTVGNTTVKGINFLINYIADNELFHCGALSDVDVATSPSMTITDGSESNMEMRRGESCSWLISPVKNAHVTLLLRWVSIKLGASIVVYDNNKPSGTILWSVSGSSTVVPPPLTSTKDALYIQYRSNEQLSDGFFGFRADYLVKSRSNSFGVGSKQELYSMSSALSISIPDNMDDDYIPNGFNYSWLVKPYGNPSNIILFMSKLHIPDCTHPLVIRNGGLPSSPIIGTYCGTDIERPWIFVSSNKALITLDVGDSMPAHGDFELAYYSDGQNYHCGFQTNPARLTAPSMIFTDGSLSTSVMYPNQHCEWLITPQDSAGIVLYFTRLDLSNSGTILIYDGVDKTSPLLASVIDSSSIPVFIQSIKSKYMRVVYTSKNHVRGFGFSATYFTIQRFDDRGGPGDSIIRLESSSYNGLHLPINVNTGATPLQTYMWYIKPSLIHDDNITLYVVISSVKFQYCNKAFQSLTLFDGPPSSVQQIASFKCNSDLYRSSIGDWIEISSGEVTLAFTTFNDGSKLISYPASNSWPSTTYTASLNTPFDLSYFSDYPSYQCGIASNPARLSASSYHISDGSGRDNSMLFDTTCEWVVVDRNQEASNIVLEFAVCDLSGGGKMYVYDGENDLSPLLWKCESCNVVPHPIISSDNSLFIRFLSPYSDNVMNSESVGKGFDATYWTIYDSSLYDRKLNNDRNEIQEHNVLVNPIEFKFENDIDSRLNDTSGWILDLSYTKSNMFFYPSYSLEEITSHPFEYRDGRKQRRVDKIYMSINDTANVCGIATMGNHHLRNDNFEVKSTQQQSRYLALLGENEKKLFDVVGKGTGSGTGNGKEYMSRIRRAEDITTLQSDSIELKPASTCRYIIDSGEESLSVTLKVLSFTSQSSRLQIISYSGEFVDSLLDTKSDITNTQTFNLLCGKAIVILEQEDLSDNVQHSLQLEYFVNSYDDSLCSKHVNELLTPTKKLSIFKTMVIPVISVTCVLFCFLCLFWCRKRAYISLNEELDAPSSTLKTKPRARNMAKRVESPYPKFTPKFDEYRNKFLFKGTCCICNTNSVKVIWLKCKHKLCVDCLTGYVSSALKDISMIPLKCPMHIEGCTHHIDASVAKRVIKEDEKYGKLIEFMDRAQHGEGIRCMFCNFYINYPTKGTVTMIECPHCIQRFCIRCKVPWHYGLTCKVELFDNSLELWTKNSGAQKCPACRQMIEKDDPDTCNHMVHKSTDGIPCVRERCDFCYFCGVEVLADYPHDEVAHVGVNHFPDGVFKKCRTILQREKEERREKMRKNRRMKSNNLMHNVEGGSNSSNRVFVSAQASNITFAGSDTEGDGDAFDAQWGQALAAPAGQAFSWDLVGGDENEDIDEYA